MEWKKPRKCFSNETDVRICSISVPHVQTSPSYLLLHMIKKQFSTNTHKTYSHPFHKLTLLWRFHDWKSFPVSKKCEKYSLGYLAKVKSITFNSRLNFLIFTSELMRQRCVQNLLKPLLTVNLGLIFTHMHVSWHQLKGLIKSVSIFYDQWRGMKKKATFLNLFDDNLIDAEQMFQKLNELYTPRSLSHS